MHVYTANELRDWQGEKDCRETVENLTRRGFAATYCATAAEAAEAALALADGAASAGFGGSRSVEELGIPARLREKGVTTLIHGGLPPEEKARVMAAQKTCDVFYLSANALTVGGEIVNIDGVGNRVSASIQGPKRVVFTATSRRRSPGRAQKPRHPTASVWVARRRAPQRACARTARRPSASATSWWCWSAVLPPRTRTCLLSTPISDCDLTREARALTPQTRDRKARRRASRARREAARCLRVR